MNSEKTPREDMEVLKIMSYNDYMKRSNYLAKLVPSGISNLYQYDIAKLGLIKKYKDKPDTADEVITQWCESSDDSRNREIKLYRFFSSTDMVKFTKKVMDQRILGRMYKGDYFDIHYIKKVLKLYGIDDLLEKLYSKKQKGIELTFLQYLELKLAEISLLLKDHKNINLT